MPFVPVPGVIRVAIQQVLGDDADVVNIFHYSTTAVGPYSADQLDKVAQGFGINWNGAIMPVLSHQLGMGVVTAHDISVVNGGDGSVDFTGDVGGGSVAALPASVAVVLSWKEFISYRGGHPRTYLTGIPNTVMADPQHITTAYQGTVIGAANSFMDNINSQAGWPTGAPPGALSVVHYRLNNRPVGPPPSVFPINDVAVHSTLRNQRRRQGP